MYVTTKNKGYIASIQTYNITFFIGDL